MKHVHFKQLLTLAFLSVFSFMAHIHAATYTWRFCNAGSAAINVFPVYSGADNPAPVAIQPWSSYDFTTSATLKGVCYSPNASDLTSCKASTGSSFYHSDQLTASFTFIFRDNNGTWSYTKSLGTLACPVQPTPPSSATVAAAQTSITAGGSTTLTATITGGTAPYTVTWSDGTTGTGSSPITRTVNPTTTTSYSITSVTDANKLSLATLPAAVSVTVLQPPTGAILTSSASSVTAGGSAMLAATITGGTAPYTVTWSDGTTGTGSSPITRTVNPTATTTYSLTQVTDANKLSLATLPAGVTVTVLPTSSATLSATQNNIIAGGTTALTAVITGGKAPYTVVWSDGYTQTGPSPFTRIITPTATTTYSLTQATDANKIPLAKLPAGVKITVTVLPPTGATLTSSANSVTAGGSATLTATITGGTAPYTITWSDGTTGTGSSPITRTVNPTTTTSYSITSVTDANKLSLATLPAAVTITASPATTTGSSGTTPTAPPKPVSQCVCTINGQANQTPPSGTLFQNNDCTKPISGTTFKPASFTCQNIPTKCLCTINGQANQNPPSNTMFSNNDCTKPIDGTTYKPASFTCKLTPITPSSSAPSVGAA